VNEPIMKLEISRISGSALPTAPVLASVVVALAAVWGSGAVWADDRPFFAHHQRGR
jgi:hypothetical protein